MLLVYFRGMEPTHHFQTILSRLCPLALVAERINFAACTNIAAQISNIWICDASVNFFCDAPVGPRSQFHLRRTLSFRRLDCLRRIKKMLRKIKFPNEQMAQILPVASGLSSLLFTESRRKEFEHESLKLGCTLSYEQIVQCSPSLARRWMWQLLF